MKSIEIGKIVNVHGVHGEVKVNPYTDGPEFFRNFKKITIDGKEYDVLSVKEAKGCSVLKLSGIDSVEQAEKYREKIVTVPESSLPKLPQGVYYVKDIEGMDVYADGDYLGVVTEVMFTGANDVYVVKNNDGEEYLIPSVPHFIKNRDVEKKRMDITHIRGITYDKD